MDSYDMLRILAILFFLVSCTSSRRTPRPEPLNTSDLDLRYKQRLANRLGFHPVPHNRTYMDKIRSSLPQPIAMKINSRNSLHPTRTPSFNRELMIVGQYLPTCLRNMISSCFVLRVNEDISSLKEATLWIDLKANDIFAGHVISINEVRLLGGTVQVGERIGGQIRIPPATSDRPESVVREMTGLVKRWSLHSRMSRNVLSRAIAIICTDCTFSGVSPVIENRVILELSLSPNMRRRKRQTGHNRGSFQNLCGSIPIHCCLRQYTLDFTRVGWDQWIVYPSEFTPNYCMGSCEGNILPQTQHASMLAAAVRGMQNLSSRQRHSMLPCCAPNSMGSFTLMYVDPKGKVRLNQMSNLVAFDCGCM